MAAGAVPVLQINGVVKRHAALRPLRIEALEVAAAERVSISGLEAGAGELLVNLVTGASLPDAGEVRVFGRRTADIAGGDEWLASLERFGIVSPRAVLLDAATVRQNLAMPFTLEIDPVPEEVADRVRQIAVRCGIDADQWLSAPAASLPSELRVRVHLARALALDPELLVLEHPTADVAPSARAALAGDMAGACSGTRLAALILTNDEEFGRAVAPRNLRLDGATGRLKPVGRRLFGW